MSDWKGGLAALFGCLATLSGCTSLRLQQSITHQATTLADLHYQQVLNNLAMLSTNPYLLPSHVTIQDGSAQIQDYGSLTAAVLLGRSYGTLGSGSPGVTGSRTVVEQWGVSPVTDDIELRLIQLAYQRALGMPVLMDFDLVNDLARELSTQTAETSDIDQRNEFASSSTFREAFAREFALAEYATIARSQTPREYVESYHEKVKLSKLLDHFALQSTVGTNSAAIILDQEYADDPSLAALDPAVYPARGRALAGSTPEYSFTPLAQSARKDVQGTQADLLSIGGGWFQTGTKRQVPKDACYVGRYHDRYAWVSAPGIRALSAFTIDILKFSDLIKESSVCTLAGGPRFTPSGGR